MNVLNQENIKKALDYNPLTGVFIWKVSNKSAVKAGDMAGCLDSDGYSIIRVFGKNQKAHRLAWLYINGYLPENCIDHIDKIRNHNSIDNLREASNQCNQRNRGNPKNNTSGIKGVGWDKKINKYKASIRINNKEIYLGYYNSYCNAVCARLAAEQCVGWNGCDSNSPAFNYVQEEIIKRYPKIGG